MHYYKFNIADWNLGTAHLSLEEEAIYFRLVNFYYDSENPIPLETDSVFRRLRLGSCSDTAGLILNEFFKKTDEGWVHSRCEEILKEYRKTARKNKLNGAKGGRPKKDGAYKETQKKPNGLPNESQKNPNQEPLTINHKPITKEKNTRGTRLPKDWKLNQEFYEAAKSIKPGYTDQQIKFCADSFRDYWLSKSGSGATKVDWLATWRNWIRRQREQNHAKRKESLAEQRERETAEILADIDSGKFDNGTMGQNGPAFRPQMEFPRGSEENGERAIDAEFSVVVPENRTPDWT